MPIGPGEWELANAMPDALREHVSPVDSQGRIYAIGGMGASGHSAACARFDPATGIWTNLNDMAVARANHRFCVDTSDRIWIFGGEDTGGQLASVERFDPGTGNWTSLADLPAAIMHVSVVIDEDDLPYVIGGFGPGVVNTTYRWNGSGWDSLDTLNLARYSASAVLYSGNGHIYIVGGQSPTDLTDTIEEYDPVGNTWTTLAAVTSEPMRDLNAVIDSTERLWILSPNTGAINTKCEVFDPASETMTSKNAMATGRSSTATAISDDDKIIICGGLGSGPAFLKSAEVYDIDTNTWTTIASMLNAHMLHTVAFDADFTAYSIGGYNLDPNDFDPFEDKSTVVEKNILGGGEEEPPPEEGLVQPGVGFIPINLH